MRIFKNKALSRWATRKGLHDAVLSDAVNEMERGLIDADLGGHVVKKRVALGGRGKRSGARTLLAYKAETRAFFVYGFAKNKRANIEARELKALRRYAAELLGYSDDELNKALKAGALIEVSDDG